jgi:hypothetical protein
MRLARKFNLDIVTNQGGSPEILFEISLCATLGLCDYIPRMVFSLIGSTSFVPEGPSVLVFWSSALYRVCTWCRQTPGAS